MPRYIHRLSVATFAALASTAALAISAAPAGAHLVCPPGTSTPAYCTNLPPLAVTVPAFPVGRTTASLNGVVDGFGDNTQYYFEYWRTTSHIIKTATQTIPGCPSGVSNSNYCISSPGTFVSTSVFGLRAGTTYRFRIVAKNPDGTTFGAIMKFTTLGGSRGR